MKVMKFGGTSVGSAERIKKVAQLVIERGRNIVVLSAMSGTTNTLIEICDYLYKKNAEGAKETINNLEAKYFGVVNELFCDAPKEIQEEANQIIKIRFDHIRSFIKEIFSVFEEREILGQGELISTALMTLYLQSLKVKAVLISALDFIKTDRHDEPDNIFIKKALSEILEQDEIKNADIIITQGFICRNAYGEVDNLQRGGSDYTASLIGAAINAEEIEIWTDIDGMHNNDPRYVNKTQPVHELHFDEAAELAYFGAKILHPTCILPAKLNNIPVRLLNSMQPDAEGTLIYNSLTGKKIKAVAAKDNITAIKIKSGRMLLAYGFLRKVFEIFESYKTPIDMIATSEVGVSVSIDSEKNLDNILNDLKKFGTVSVDHDMVIICVVGDLEWNNQGFESEVLNALKDIPVRMISYGGSNYNISLLVKKEDKIKALNALNDNIFNKE